MVEEWLNNNGEPQDAREAALRNTIFRILFATGDERLRLEGTALFVDDQEFDPSTFNGNDGHDDSDPQKHIDADYE